MNDDILAKAESLLGRLSALMEHGKERPNAVVMELIDVREEMLGMLPELVSEVNRLRGIEKFLEIESEDSDCVSISINGKTYYSIDVYNEKVDQLAAKDDRISKLEGNLARWRKIAIEEKVKLRVINGDCPNRTPIKNSLIYKCDKSVICRYETCPCINAFREHAAKEMGIQIESRYIDDRRIKE